jgi:hypothetical protein
MGVALQGLDFDAEAPGAKEASPPKSLPSFMVNPAMWCDAHMAGSGKGAAARELLKEPGNLGAA